MCISSHSICKPSSYEAAVKAKEKNTPLNVFFQPKEFSDTIKATSWSAFKWLLKNSDKSKDSPGERTHKFIKNSYLLLRAVASRMPLCRSKIIAFFTFSKQKILKKTLLHKGDLCRDVNWLFKRNEKTVCYMF